ncbi:MAG: DNA-3-methyladenine glycosylase [Clostridia bacterium]|nr:DNA-3-methyladenine glycosylase [Clostridia bacterium]
MNNIEYKNNKIYIKNATNFDLAQTLDCGQAFRWSVDEQGVWTGIAFNKYIRIYHDGNDIIIENSSEQDFKNIWQHYFDLDRDYGEIIKTVSTDQTVKTAAEFSHGIRLLNQDSWEALCSFIISQNNNIPRIKGIIERLCKNFGDKIAGGYTFPNAQKIALLSIDDLAVIRSGFRAKYIIDAAQKVASGEIDLEALKTTDYNTACDILMQIKGVGPKVADCVLLYGLGHIEAFPRDVWIKRALTELFDGDLPECARVYAGIVQQYIFHYIRNK